MLAKIFYVFQPSKIKIAKKKNPKQAAWFSLNAKTEEKKPFQLGLQRTLVS
jgi:hypothetical protein